MDGGFDLNFPLILQLAFVLLAGFVAAVRWQFQMETAVGGLYSGRGEYPSGLAEWSASGPPGYRFFGTRPRLRPLQVRAVSPRYDARLLEWDAIAGFACSPRSAVGECRFWNGG